MCKCEQARYLAATICPVDIICSTAHIMVCDVKLLYQICSAILINLVCYVTHVKLCSAESMYACALLPLALVSRPSGALGCSM